MVPVRTRWARISVSVKEATVWTRPIRHARVKFRITNHLIPISPSTRELFADCLFSVGPCADLFVVLSVRY